MEASQVVPEVLFCDLCNTSVPVLDVQNGTAVRHQGKTVGGCCLPALRLDASKPADRPGVHVGAGDGRMLTLGVVVMVALASVALFLDYRMGQAESRSGDAIGRLAQAMRSQGEVVQSISIALDNKAERADAQGLATALAGMTEGQKGADERLAGLQQSLAGLSEAVAGLARQWAGAEKARPDHGPVLAELQRQLQQQAVSIAELLARPRPAEASVEPRESSAPSVPAMPEGDLAPEVAHQVARLADRDEGVRFEAVDDLLKRREPKVLPHLLPLVKDPDTFVRRLVVEGLKDFAKPEVVDALLVALADPEEIVRDSAWRSLKELTRQNLPFEAAGTRDARARQQQKWQEWWEKNKAGFGS